ncbi:ser thr protein phosphatase [Rhizoctonia solani AG-3 Rhs1AP]|uniref:Ser thr protein phosphatase n=1 Tax=Rhizoctonia solani AG-3 Rhs1AP TaxID=1086054 RepID=X8JG36_9AGAM|nr:ser thr protein phosphatase [Rhizoctonia solani AG-3 Rhs1AP]
MRVMLFGALAAVGLAVATPVPPFVDPSDPAHEVPRPTRPLEWGDVNVLHTTDIHGWISGHSKPVYPEKSWSGDFGDLYSFTKRMRRMAAERGSDILLVDTGDRRIGHGLTDHILDPLTDINGQNVSYMYRTIRYDLVVPGNHDLQNPNVVNFTMNRLVKLWGDKYLTSNINRVNGTSLGARFRYWKTPMGKQMMAFGVVTAKADTPKGLLQKVVPINEMIKQKWFKDAIKPKSTRPVDVFVLLGHVDPQETKEDDNIVLIYEAIRREHPLTPILIFAGHTHKRWCRTFEVEGNFTRSMLIQSGEYFDTVGWMSVKLDNNTTPQNLTFSRRYLDNNVKTYMFHTGIKDEVQFHTSQGKRLSRYIEKMEKSEALSKVYGELDRDYYLDRKEWTEKEQDESSLFSFYLDATATSLIDSKKSPNWLFFSNWGIVRGSIYRGPFTLSDLYAISPDASDKSPFLYTTVPRRIADQIVEMTQRVDKARGNLEKVPRLQARDFKTIKDDSQAHFFSSPDKPVATTYGRVTTDECGSDGDDISHVEIPKVKFDKAKSGLPVYFWRKNYASELGLEEPVDIIVTNRTGSKFVPGALELLGTSVANRELKAYRDDVNQYNLILEYVQNKFPSTPATPLAGKKDA